MRLHDLKPRPGAKHRRKRLGHRANPAAMARPADAVGKGQTARSGSSIRIGFEGGTDAAHSSYSQARIQQCPSCDTLHPSESRRPSINSKMERGVDEAAIRSAGLANGPSSGVKILGDGELTRKLTVSAHAFQRFRPFEDRGQRRLMRKSSRPKKTEPRKAPAPATKAEPSKS